MKFATQISPLLNFIDQVREEPYSQNKFLQILRFLRNLWKYLIFLHVPQIGIPLELSYLFIWIDSNQLYGTPL